MFLKRLFFIILIFTFVLHHRVHADHLFGGQMTYKMIDSAQGVFEITLMLERPCNSTPLLGEYAIHVLEFIGSTSSGTYQKNVYVAKLVDSNFIYLPCNALGQGCTSTNSQVIEQKFYRVNIIIQQSPKECLVYFKEANRSYSSNIFNPDQPLCLFVSFIPTYNNKKAVYSELGRTYAQKNIFSKLNYLISDKENDSLQVLSSAPLIDVSYSFNGLNLIYQLEKALFLTGNTDLKPFPITQSQLDIQSSSIGFTSTSIQSSWLSLMQHEYRKINLGIKDTWVKISSSNSDRLISTNEINSQVHLSSIKTSQPNVHIAAQSITICNQIDSSQIIFKFPIEKSINLSQFQLSLDSLLLNSSQSSRKNGVVLDTVLITLKFKAANNIDFSGKIKLNLSLCHAASGQGIVKEFEVNLNIFNYKIFLEDTIQSCASSLQIPVQILKPFTVNYGQVYFNPYFVHIAVPKDTVIIATLSQSNAYCPFRDTIVIAHGSLFSTEITGYPPSCKGMSNASAKIKVTGSNSPYTFLWTNFSTQDTIGSIASGTHLVQIKDKDGCSQWDTIVINDVPGIDATWIVDTQISCYNGSNGTGHFIINSNIKPYLYSWDHSTSIDSFLGNFSHGNYSGKFQYTNLNGKNCQQNFSIQFVNPELIKLQTIVTDNKCFGDSLGKLALIPSGGIAPYSYFFDSVWSNSGLKLNLKNDTIQVFVSDSKGCVSAKTSSVITSPSSIDYLFTKVKPSCMEVANGSISVDHITGGESPFLISFENSSYSGINLYPNLKSKTYLVKVKDKNECIIQKSTTILPIYALNANLDSIANSICPKSNNGKAHYSITNGLAPYTIYHLLDSSINYNKKLNFSPLAKGTYTLRIKDQNQCIFTTNYSITEPDSFYLNSSTKDETCYGYNNGKIVANMPNGGSLPYKWLSWTDQSGQFISRIDSLSPGTYFFNLIDRYNCSFTKEFLIQAKSIFNVKIDTIQSIKCNGSNDGHLRAKVNGGSQPLSFIWNSNPSLQLSELTQIPAGQYNLSVKDVDQCIASASSYLPSPEAIKLDFLKTKNQDCPSINNGVVTLSCKGGTSVKTPLSYAISPNYSYTSLSSFANLSSGNYKVKVKDDNECVDSFTTTILLDKSIEINIQPQIDCSLGETILLKPTLVFGANSNNSDIKSIAWNPQTNISCIDCIQTEYTATRSGNYSLQIGYGNGCTAVANIMFNVAKPEEIFIPNSFSPNGDQKNDSWMVYGKNIKSINIKVFNKVGEMVFYSTDIMKGWNGIYHTKPMPIDAYRYIVQAKYIDESSRIYEGILNLIR